MRGWTLPELCEAHLGTESYARMTAMTLTHRTLSLAWAACLTLTPHVWAGDLNNLSSLSQTEFLALSKDLAATTSTKSMEPAASLGMAGFDVSASTTLTQTQAGSAWQTVSGNSMRELVQTKMSVSKGLSSKTEVGGFVAKVSSTNISAAGMHVKYALIEGNAIMPALALRGSYSRMGSVSGMALNNTGLDVLLSKGFVGFTPYVGVGTVYTQASATGKADENFRQHKSFAGVSWNVVLLNLSAEYDRTGKNASYGFKAGLRF